MSAFQRNRSYTEQKVLIKLLSELDGHGENHITQRTLADRLGIALGLMNQYLKSCIAKGWVRASQVSPKRISYFLTPEGFHEKTIMVRDYVSRSLSFFKDARLQCDQVFQDCLEKGWKNIGLIGSGDLCDIATLVAQGTGIHIYVTTLDNLKEYDAVLITDIYNPQGTFDQLKKIILPNRVLTLDLLHISRGGL